MFHEFDELAKSMDEVIRAGEGSRGGHIIGHTTSGNPIYETKMQHIDSGVHHSYTAKDHKEAEQAHKNPTMKKFHQAWQKLKGNPLNKSLSHDPFNPVVMSEESNFYNPYKLVDGGFMPHSVEYWREQGRPYEVDDYTQTKHYYSKFFNAQSAMKSFAQVLGEDISKGGAVPVGTVHTYKNGDKFKKISEGKWAPIGETKSPANHDQTEKDAQKIAEIRDAINKKYQESGKEQAQGAATHAQLKEFAHAVFGDELPEGVKAHLDKKEQELTQPNVPKAMEKPVKEIQNAFTKRHNADVTFKVGGREYTHKFTDVSGISQSDVQEQIENLLKKKIPGAVITRLKTELSKEDIQKQKQAQLSQGVHNEPTR